jgi:hypothetical protein
MTHQDRVRKGLGVLTLAASLVTLVSASCGPPRDSSIVYKKLTPEEFAKLPPEEQETPEVQENMGAAWKDPNLPENAANPKRPIRRRASR